MATGIPTNRSNPNFETTSNSSSRIHLEYDGKVSNTAIFIGEAARLNCIAGSSAVENRLIYSDNLKALRTLRNDPSVCGKVKLIYIDPPYATGFQFHSRDQEHAYSDHLDGAHYLEFLRQRLILMREILAVDGSIYVHLDGNMVFHAKVLMDEIFGVGNFRNFITRRKANPKNYTRKTYGNISDYILFYSKSDKYIWNQQFEELSESALKEYRYIEEDTGRHFMKVPVHAPGIRKGATGGEWRGMMPPPGKHWQYTPETLDKMDADGEIFWSSTGNPRRKVYLDIHKGVGVQDIWWDFKDAHNQNIKVTGYPTEKNSDLLKRIILASSNKGDLVLDVFGGSGTTAEVAAENGRCWIMVDNSPKAIITTVRRLVKGSEVMGDYVSKKRSKSIGESKLFYNTDRKHSHFFIQMDTDESLPTIDNDEIGKWKMWLA